MVHWKETKKGIAIPISVIGAIAFIIVVMLLIPVLFFNSGHNSGNYYKSIFIEPVLGMTLGYLVYSMIPKHGSNVRFEIFNLCVALSDSFTKRCRDYIGFWCDNRSLWDVFLKGK